ncbi:MAG TPA: DUF2975 domain-containing protein [Bacillota bacterium]|nr:DUF2975 domain-containing protein [Bacillota bacterium]
MKIDKRSSVYISAGLTAISMLMLIAAMFYIPLLCDTMVARHFEGGEAIRGGQIIDSISPAAEMLLKAMLYVLDVLGIACCACLSGLIVKIMRAEVFTDMSVFFLRVISWLCIFASLGFSFIGLYFTVSFFVAFAAAFFGIVIRVVKNVMEEATSIKNENDFTV